LGKDSTSRLLSEATQTHCLYGGCYQFTISIIIHGRLDGLGGFEDSHFANHAFSKRGGDLTFIVNELLRVSLFRMVKAYRVSVGKMDDVIE